MDYCRSGLWKFKCWEELRSRATEQIIEAIDRKLCGQFKCEKLHTETNTFFSFRLHNLCSFSTCSQSPFIHTFSHAFSSSPPSSASSAVPCLVLLTWTMAPLALSCEKEHLDNSHWLFSNCPAGRITSSVWGFKVPLIQLGQASPTLTDFSFFNPPRRHPFSLLRSWFLGVESLLW